MRLPGVSIATPMAVVAIVGLRHYDPEQSPILADLLVFGCLPFAKLLGISIAVLAVRRPNTGRGSWPIAGRAASGLLAGLATAVASLSTQEAAWDSSSGSGPRSGFPGVIPSA